MGRNLAKCIAASVRQSRPDFHVLFELLLLHPVESLEPILLYLVRKTSQNRIWNLFWFRKVRFRVVIGTAYLITLLFIVVRSLCT